MSVHGEIFDITFIGAGPVGLYGSIYAGKKGMRVKVIDSQPQAGGRLITHYPDKKIYDVAGHPRIVARELIDNLVSQCGKTEFVFNQNVDRIEKDAEGIWSVFTTAGEHRSKTVIVTAGIGAFLPAKLETPKASELEGKGIFYNIEKLEKFKGKNVVLIGTGDNAMRWVDELRKVASKVVFAHRLNRLNKPDDTSIFDDPKVEMKYPFFELKEIHADEKLKSVTIFNSTNGEEETIETDALVLNVGFLANMNRLRSWGLVVDNNSVRVNSKMETNLDGVYAAGDIVSHPGKIKLISTGAGEVARAVKSAVEYVKELPVIKARPKGLEPKALSADGLYLSGFESSKMAEILEGKALEFYTAAFFRAPDGEAKNLFAKMQRRKLDAMNTIKEKLLPVFAASRYELEDLDNTAITYLKSKAGKFIYGGINLTDEALSHSTSDLQNVYVAIRVEEDLKLFYERLVREPKLKDAENILQNFIDRKSEELNIIRDAQAKMMESGF